MVHSFSNCFCAGQDLPFSIRSATLFFRYEFLRKLMYPLPSYSTICKRISSIKMHVGV